MGERNLGARRLDRFSSFSHLDPAPLGVTSEVPRRSLTNVGLEPLLSKTLLREAFRAPATRRQATSPVSQRSTSVSPRNCSKRTRPSTVEDRPLLFWTSPTPPIRPLPSGLESAAAAPPGFVDIGDIPPTTSRPLHSVPGSVDFGAPNFVRSARQSAHYSVTSPSLLPTNAYNVDLLRCGFHLVTVKRLAFRSLVEQY